MQLQAGYSTHRQGWLALCLQCGLIGGVAANFWTAASAETPAPKKTVNAPASKGSDEPKSPFRTPEDKQRWIENVSNVRYSQNHQRDHETVKLAFQESVREARRCTVRVFAHEDQVSLGTIVDANGYVLTKASELYGKLKVRLWDGRKFPAEIIGVNKDYDLAVLKIEATELPVVKWRTEETPIVGSWLATVGHESVPEAIGVVSAAPRKVLTPQGMLGVLLEDDQAGARITQVMPGSAADRVRLQLNDVITHLNGSPVADRRTLVESIQKLPPGRVVELKLRRDGNSVDLKATLGDRNAGPQSERSEFQNALGGKLSDRRAGFPVALQHDTVLRPNLCGGPVVDLDGRVVGVNIARAGRVASYALPGDAIRPLLDELKSGKLAPDTKTLLVDMQKNDSE